MQNYGIGLSGLDAATTALDVIGNNVANAATEGYHRQRVELLPSSYGCLGNLGAGGGVDVAGVIRMVDRLLEREIVSQESSHGKVSQELSTLRAVETTLGEFAEGGGLNATIDAFFDALRGLAAHPLERIWRNETISSAQVLASEFRRLGNSLASMEDQIVLEAQNTTESMNLLIHTIAELNGKIQAIEINGGQANNLRDHRDQLIGELATLVGIETQERDYGVLDVSVAGLPVVTGGLAVEVQARLQGGQTLGVAAAGSDGYTLDIRGGKLGALLSLKSGLLPDLRSDLDTLASGIINQINRYHVQGLGLDGSFTQLTGWVMPSESLADSKAPIQDGTFHIRVTETATGRVERHAIDVDVTGSPPDTLGLIATKITDASSHLSASGVSSLTIVAEQGYTFDFLPALLPEPVVSNVAPTVAVSGIYNADANQTFTFTVVGTGSVGNGDLRLNVTDENNDVVATLNVGVGYAAGDAIELLNGIKVSLGMGDLNDGESFQVRAYATTDTSGFLAAVGMNAFFGGAGASDMRVLSEVADAPDRIASAIGSDLTDNQAAVRLSGVHDEAVEQLDGMTPGQYYHRLVASLGQHVALGQSRQDNIEAMIQNLEGRRSDISGVNINDEAAQIMVFEKMFQAVAKYMNTLQTAMNTLMDLV